jgi:hypothetical protein
MEIEVSGTEVECQALLDVYQEPGIHTNIDVMHKLQHVVDVLKLIDKSSEYAAIAKQVTQKTAINPEYVIRIVELLQEAVQKSATHEAAREYTEINVKFRGTDAGN